MVKFPPITAFPDTVDAPETLESPVTVSVFAEKVRFPLSSRDPEEPAKTILP